jgi:hypothetical protein
MPNYGGALLWLLEEHFSEVQQRAADSRALAGVAAASSSSSSVSSSISSESWCDMDDEPSLLLPWILPFSSRLYTAVSAFGLQQSLQQLPASSINSDNLKSSIMENLSKDLAKRDVIVLDGLSFSNTSNTSSTSLTSTYTATPTALLKSQASDNVCQTTRARGYSNCQLIPPINWYLLLLLQ